MARLSVVNFISMDGVVQSPMSPDEDRDGGFTHGGWVLPFSDGVVNQFMQDATVGADGMLLGRRTYEIFFVTWADADESEAAIAAMNRMPKYVVSSSNDLAWSNSHRIGGHFRSAIEDLKRRTPGDLVVFGSATLVQSLAEHDLVDEYRLLLVPILLGSGKRMFGGQGALARFRLADWVVSPSGVVIHTHVRDRQPQ